MTDLVVHVGLNVDRRVVPDLDVGQVEIVDHVLDPVRLARRRGRQSEDPVVVVPSLDQRDQLAVRSVAGRLVRLVCISSTRMSSPRATEGKGAGKTTDRRRAG